MTAEVEADTMTTAAVVTKIIDGGGTERAGVIINGLCGRRISYTHSDTLRLFVQDPTSLEV